MGMLCRNCNYTLNGKMDGCKVDCDTCTYYLIHVDDEPCMHCREDNCGYKKQRAVYGG